MRLVAALETTGGVKKKKKGIPVLTFVRGSNHKIRIDGSVERSHDQ